LFNHERDFIYLYISIHASLFPFSLSLSLSHLQRPLFPYLLVIRSIIQINI